MDPDRAYENKGTNRLQILFFLLRNIRLHRYNFELPCLGSSEYTLNKEIIFTCQK